jgi:hypothetical protein
MNYAEIPYIFKHKIPLLFLGKENIIQMKNYSKTTISFVWMEKKAITKWVITDLFLPKIF